MERANNKNTQKGPKSNARTKMAEQLDTVPGTNVEVLATNYH